MLRPFPFSLLPTQANTSIISKSKCMNTNTFTTMHSAAMPSDTTFGQSLMSAIVGINHSSRRWIVSVALMMVMMLSGGVSWGQTNPTTGSIPFSFTGEASVPSTIAIHRFGTSSGAIPTTRTTSDGNGARTSRAR